MSGVHKHPTISFRVSDREREMIGTRQDVAPAFDTLATIVGELHFPLVKSDTVAID